MVTVLEAHASATESHYTPSAHAGYGIHGTCRFAALVQMYGAQRISGQFTTEHFMTKHVRRICSRPLGSRSFVCSLATLLGKSRSGVFFFFFFPSNMLQQEFVSTGIT